MRLSFKNIALLFCVGTFGEALAKSSYYQGYISVHKSVEVSTSSSQIESSFNSKKTDDCQKAAAALYKLQGYLDNGKIYDYCESSLNKYAKFLDDGFNCKDEEYNDLYLKTAMAQREYLCTFYNKNGRCYNYNFTNIEDELTEENLKNEICSANVNHICKEAYMKFIKSLTIVPEDANRKFTDSNKLNEKHRKDLVQIRANGITYQEVKSVSHFCSIDTDLISENGKCGEGLGKCPGDKCCSKYGYCGTSSKHCDSGCQSAFGKCNSNSNKKTKTTVKKTKTTTTTKKTKSKSKTTSTKASKATKVSQDGTCGSKQGRCRDGYCCSKYGWCGNTDSHCKKSNGCQSEFGKCY